MNIYFLVFHNLHPGTLAGHVHNPLSGLNLVPKNLELKADHGQDQVNFGLTCYLIFGSLSLLFTGTCP